MATIAEIQEKQTKLEAELATALEAAKVLQPATPEFDEAYGRYLAAKAAIAKIPTEIAEAKKAENADAIKADGATVAEGIKQLLEGLKTADKLGEPVISVVWTQGAAKEGEPVPAPVVHFNPKAKVASTGTRKASGAGRTTVLTPTGETLSLTKFVLANASEEEAGKYPHTLVDSKPKFDEFCTKHSLTGYTYQRPES
jgi:hypothetical protein